MGGDMVMVLHEKIDVRSVATATQPTPRPTWPLYVIIAVLFGSYQGFNQMIGLRSAPIAWWKPFVWELSSILTIAALIPLIVRFERYCRLDARPRSRTIAVHIMAAVAFSIVHTTSMVLLRKLTYLLAGESYDFGNVFIGAAYELQKDVITYVIILVVIFAFREFRVRRAGELRAAQLATELGEARLRHLTAQIEPHFLFNSLNAISNRMHENVGAADRMISHLADLLRAAYDSDQQVFVALGRELDWLRDYAAMMAERFRGQMSFEFAVEPGIETLQVPRLLLQPIVENAITHGLGDGRGWLKVTVRRMDTNLCYIVSDDGVGLPKNEQVERGTGLSNVSRRLELLFPDNHTLTFSARTPRGTTVTMSFPAHQ